MDKGYFSIKVTVSPLDGNRFRSRVEQVPKGTSFGAGSEFELDLNAAHGNALSISDFTKAVHEGTVGNKGSVPEFGKWLFDSVFQGSVRDRYHGFKEAARLRKEQFRICLSLHSPQLMNVPWEYFHDGTNFLLRHGYSIVRVMEELEGGKSSFAPIRTLLVAIANPRDASGVYETFDSNKHLQTLRGLLKNSSAIDGKVLNPASADNLLKYICSNEFDAVYFLGHGEAADFGGRLICEGPKHQPELLEANDLAEALRKGHKTRFVYLNSCSTAKTVGQNPFEAVAQRIMLDGDVAAVAAMQVDIRQKAGIRIAEAFFAELKDTNAEDAMLAARSKAKDVYSFGIPVLYTYVDAPDQLKKNRLYSFLSAGPDSKFALLLPSFRLGSLIGEKEPAAPTDGNYRFPGETFSRSDTESALYVSQLLNDVAAPENISIYPHAEGLKPEYTHYFLFGSKSNPKVQSVLDEYSRKFSFDYAAGPQKDNRVLQDLEYGHEYRIENPDQLVRKNDETDDYGVIQKIKGNKVFFLIAGLGSRATKACSWYLLKNWAQHVLEGEFAILLRVPKGFDYGLARVINRATGKPG